jgi:hypothetical protein
LDGYVTLVILGSCSGRITSCEITMLVGEADFSPRRISPLEQLNQNLTPAKLYSILSSEGSRLFLSRVPRLALLLFNLPYAVFDSPRYPGEKNVRVLTTG